MPDNDQSLLVTLNEDETQFIDDAAKYLENPSLLMKIANVIGKPVELLFLGIDRLAPNVVNKIVEPALSSALYFSIKTISDKSEAVGGLGDKDLASAGKSADWWHTLSVMVTGGAGGLFGLPGCAVELPVTTTIMLRSIAAVARDFGEDLDDPNVRLQCLTVFAYGGPSHTDDAMESSYLTTRISLQEVFREAANFVGKVGAKRFAAIVEEGTAPIVVRLIASVAARFDIVVTEKLVAQTIPVLGALSGAAINVAFIDHFNRVARYHFGICKLERKYGQERVQSLFRAAARGIKREPKPALF